MSRRRGTCCTSSAGGCGRDGGGATSRPCVAISVAAAASATNPPTFPHRTLRLRMPVKAFRRCGSPQLR
jgi:hypothetical protein